MKKSLIVTLALVFVLGIAGTAFAANPFTDVPANHWAYASISKLAQAGIIDGYGDGRYVGNSNMTRYEMAQIVAKAMAKVDSADAAQKAQIEKLAAEFADELDSLGVRVAKLEKNADNVKITGEVRIAWYSFDNGAKDGGGNEQLRTRLFLSGQVNDRWTYGAMLENKVNFRTNGRTGEDATTFRRAWVDGKIGVVNMTVGRYTWKPVYGIVLDEEVDGVMFGYGQDNWKAQVFAMRPTFTNSALQNLGAAGNNEVIGAVVGYDNKKLDVNLAYYHTDATADNGENSNIIEVAAGYRFNKDFRLWAEYLRGSADIGSDSSKSGWAAGLDFGKVTRSKAGTWALRAIYYDVPGSAMINTTPELDYGTTAYRNNTAFDGYKGFQIGGTVMLAKNIDFNIDYFDFEGQDTKDSDNTLFWTYVRFYF